MLDNLPDWVGPAVAAFIAGAFGALAAMVKARGDAEAREDERTQKAVTSYYADIRCDVDKLREDVERQRLRIRELETALALRTDELTTLQAKHDGLQLDYDDMARHVEELRAMLTQAKHDGLQLDYDDMARHVEELRAMLTQEGRDVPPLPRPRRPRRGGGE